MAVDPCNLNHDFTLMGEITKLLNSHYPVVVQRTGVEERVNGAWSVEVLDNVAIVRNVMLSGKWGFNYRLTGNWKIDSRKIIYYGGELLERFNAKRGTVDFDALANLPRNIAREVIGDHSK